MIDWSRHTAKWGYNMKLNRGQLSTPIEILRAQTTQDDYGAVVSSFSPVSQTFCEWLPLSADAVMRSAAEGMTMTAKLHVDLHTDIRYADKIKNLTTHDVCEVISVMPVPADNKKIIICKALYV